MCRVAVCRVAVCRVAVCRVAVCDCCGVAIGVCILVTVDAVSLIGVIMLSVLLLLSVGRCSDTFSGS